MFDTKSFNDEHDCNVVSINSLNIHEANDMQSHKLGEAMFDEYAMFSPPSFDENIYYDKNIILIKCSIPKLGTNINCSKYILKIFHPH